MACGHTLNLECVRIPSGNKGLGADCWKSNFGPLDPLFVLARLQMEYIGSTGRQEVYI
jgi:hypothetical protein